MSKTRSHGEVMTNVPFCLSRYNAILVSTPVTCGYYSDYELTTRLVYRKLCPIFISCGVLTRLSGYYNSLEFRIAGDAHHAANYGLSIKLRLHEEEVCQLPLFTAVVKDGLTRLLCNLELRRAATCRARITKTDILAAVWWR